METQFPITCVSLEQLPPMSSTTVPLWTPPEKISNLFIPKYVVDAGVCNLGEAIDCNVSLKSDDAPKKMWAAFDFILSTSCNFKMSWEINHRHYIDKPKLKYHIFERGSLSLSLALLQLWNAVIMMFFKCRYRRYLLLCLNCCFSISQQYPQVVRYLTNAWWLYQSVKERVDASHASHWCGGSSYTLHSLYYKKLFKLTYRAIFDDVCLGLKERQKAASSDSTLRLVIEMDLGDVDNLSNFPAPLQGHINSAQWGNILEKFRKAKNETLLMSCGGEALCCCLTGFFCIFCCHPIIHQFVLDKNLERFY